VLSGSPGPDVVDIRPLYANTVRQFRRSCRTASCTSAITYIDGVRTAYLLYRGYPIEQLRSTRLPRGLLPAPERRAAEPARKKEEFVGIVTHHTMVHGGWRALRGDSALAPWL